MGFKQERLFPVLISISESQDPPERMCGGVDFQFKSYMLPVISATKLWNEVFGMMKLYLSLLCAANSSVNLKLVLLLFAVSEKTKSIVDHE